MVELEYKGPYRPIESTYTDQPHQKCWDVIDYLGRPVAGDFPNRKEALEYANDMNKDEGYENVK